MTQSDLSLILCAFAYRFPSKPNCELVDMIGQKLRTGQKWKIRQLNTGPGQNYQYFKMAARLAKVKEIQVLVASTKVFKFCVKSAKRTKVMQVHCNSATAKHPSYSLQEAI